MSSCYFFPEWRGKGTNTHRSVYLYTTLRDRRRINSTEKDVTPPFPILKTGLAVCIQNKINESVGETAPSRENACSSIINSPPLSAPPVNHGLSILPRFTLYSRNSYKYITLYCTCFLILFKRMLPHDFKTLVDFNNNNNGPNDFIMISTKHLFIFNTYNTYYILYTQYV